MDKETLSNFKFKGEYKNHEKFGSGHINTTYLVTYQDENGEEYKYVRNERSFCSPHARGCGRVCEECPQPWH